MEKLRDKQSFRNCRIGNRVQLTLGRLRLFPLWFFLSPLSFLDHVLASFQDLPQVFSTEALLFSLCFRLFLHSNDLYVGER